MYEYTKKFYSTIFYRLGILSIAYYVYVIHFSNLTDNIMIETIKFEKKIESQNGCINGVDNT